MYVYFLEQKNVLEVGLSRSELLNDAPVSFLFQSLPPGLNQTLPYLFLSLRRQLLLLRRIQSSPDIFPQLPDGVRLIQQLGSGSITSCSQKALFGQLRGHIDFELFFGLFGEPCGVFQLETDVHFGGNAVHVLPARPRGAGVADLALGNGDDAIKR